MFLEKSEQNVLKKTNRSLVCIMQLRLELIQNEFDLCICKQLAAFLILSDKDHKIPVTDSKNIKQCS